MENKRIRLAIDTHHLLLEDAGTKRVTLNLLQELHKNKALNVFEYKPTYKIPNGKKITDKLARHILRFFWVHFQLPFICYRKKADVLLSPEYNTPLFTTCKKVVIVHDVHMRAQRQFNSSLWFYCYYIPYIESAIKRADLIITISNFSKQEIIKWMHIDEKKIVAVYWGGDKLFLTAPDENAFENLTKQYAIEKNKYLLFVGTFEARKNIERIIEAFKLLQKRDQKGIQDIKLVIAGKGSGSKFSDRTNEIKSLVEKYELTNKVIFSGFIPDHSLAALYSNSLCVLFPSLYEGFGFPIIEGFASGRAVITSNICSMPEIAGDAALLVDPYSVADLELKIFSLLEDSNLRVQLIDAGKIRLQDFDWSITSDKIVKELGKLMIR